MRREAATPRPGWQQKLEQLGFDYYVLEGKAYWTEQACYAFTSDEIDTLAAATEELHGMCRNAVEQVVSSKLLQRKTIAVQQIGGNGRRFTDTDEMPIQVMSKLYPWEWMVREEFGAHVLTDTTAFIEPAWKMILSNKMLLPLLWEGFPGHANLLPAFATEHADLGTAYVNKPRFARDGHNVTIVGPGLFDTAAR